MGWATGWATRLAHRVLMSIKTNHDLTHWANGLPIGLNNNGPSRLLAWWAVGFLGLAVGRGLFDDPYPDPIPGPGPFIKQVFYSRPRLAQLGPVNPSQIWAQFAARLTKKNKIELKCKETHKTPLRYFGKCKEKSKMFDLSRT